MCSSLIGLLDVLLDNRWSGSEDVMMLQRKFLTLLSKKVANIFFRALQLLFFLISLRADKGEVTKKMNVEKKVILYRLQWENSLVEYCQKTSCSLL